jgi:hypothetical protein
MSPSGGLDGELIHLKPLGWVGGPIVLLDSQWLEVYRPMHPFQVTGESFDSSYIMPSFRGALPVRLVVVGTITIIVPLIMLILFHALSLSMPVFDPVVCISAVDDVTQVTVVPPTSLATLLRRSDATGQVLVRTLSVAKLVTPVSVFMIVDRIHHGCCVQHRLEALDMHVDFFIIFG